jgi:hypothetical protein
MYRHIVLGTAVALILGTTNYLMAQDDASLFGWWKLDEGQGTVIGDSSGKGHDGALSNPNGGKGPGGSSWMEDEERGWVLSFNGNNTTGAYVVTGATIPALDLTKDFTWMFWCKQASAGGGVNQTILGNRYGGTQAPLQFIKFTPTKFEYYNDDTTYATSITYATPMPDGEWVHNTGVKKGNKLSYYRNGVQMGASTTVGKTIDANPFYIGGDPQGERWNGELSDVRLYERALTDAEIKAIGAHLKAYKPNPANGDLAVGMPLLSWTAGVDTMFQNVYLGTSPDLTEADLVASRQMVMLCIYYHLAGLTPGATYYWRVDEIEKDNVTVHTGDVWTFVAQDVVAYHPSPADQSNEATTSPTLTWLPGLAAVTHQVYFSDSVDAVTQRAADADKGTLAVDTPTFAPEPLESLTTYYWCVDETVGGAVKAGQVWSFTTSLSIDDFESYTDAPGECIFDTWIDGMADGSSGSIVGHLDAPFAEQSIVHGGLQSMPFEYNNVGTPFYSEAVFEPAATDWTNSGADTLVLYVRGTPGNKPASLYVAVEDTSKHSAAIVYPDPAITAVSKWTQWTIPLSSFTGVNLARIKKLYLGAGDKENPVAGGTGTLYIDDIRLTKP